MIKTARKYSHDKYGQGRATVIITLNHSFHGRTITTLKATGQDHYHENFLPLPRGLPLRRRQRHGQPPLPRAGDDVCAVMMELIQGEGGVNPLQQGLRPGGGQALRGAGLAPPHRRGADRHRPHRHPLCLPAVRRIQPDVVTFAKGIAGGLPFGGFLTNEKCRKVLGAGDHGSTFGGNPMAAAAAAW